MGGLEHLLLGFQIAITPFNLVMAVIGIVLGTIIGVLPAPNRHHNGYHSERRGATIHPPSRLGSATRLLLD